MNKKIIPSISAILLVLPAIALAQPLVWGGGGFTAFLDHVIYNIVLPSLWFISVGFIIVMFSLAGFKYLTAQGDAGKVAEANKAVIWGAAGTIVVVIAWSIITLVRIDIGV